MNDLSVTDGGDYGVASMGAGLASMQARELAETQTRYLMAQRFPRNERQALDRIKNAFSRPGLAERASYQYARGGSDIDGPSIHAAQAIAQGWENVEFGFRELSRGIGPDGVPFSEVEAFATDLQGRVPRRVTFIARHWRDTKGGGYRLKDDRDVFELVSNLAQRRVRGCILSVIPSDVVDEAMRQAEETLKAKADVSPEAVSKMVAAFGAFGVTREHIEKRIQRRLDSITPAQVIGLKRVYASLRDEMSEPKDWFDLADAPEQKGNASAPAEAVRAAVQGKRAAKATQAPPPPPAAPVRRSKALAEAIEAVQSAQDRPSALDAMDAKREELTEDEFLTVASAFDERWPPTA